MELHMYAFSPDGGYFFHYYPYALLICSVLWHQRPLGRIQEGAWNSYEIKCAGKEGSSGFWTTQGVPKFSYRVPTVVCTLKVRVLVTPLDIVLSLSNSPLPNDTEGREAKKRAKERHEEWAPSGLDDESSVETLCKWGVGGAWLNM